MTNHTPVIQNQLDALLLQSEALAALATELLDRNDPLRAVVLTRVAALNAPVQTQDAYTGSAYVSDAPLDYEQAGRAPWGSPYDEDNADVFDDDYSASHERDTYDEDDEDYAPLPAKVGVEVNEETGEVAVTGDVDEMAEVATSILEEKNFDAVENGDTRLEASPLFSVVYTLVDEEGELTDADVHTILKHPISAPLNHLGRIRLINIVPESDDEDNVWLSSKRANFELVEEGTLPLEALAARVLSYAGSHPFPRIGVVQARGEFHLVR